MPDKLPDVAWRVTGSDRTVGHLFEMSRDPVNERVTEPAEIVWR